MVPRGEAHYVQSTPARGGRLYSSNVATVASVNWSASGTLCRGCETVAPHEVRTCP
jgi:hypothetical protein